eukprot:scaffold416163_cov25-Prasinocladus_malaysianus.AAC.1
MISIRVPKLGLRTHPCRRLSGCIFSSISGPLLPGRFRLGPLRPPGRHSKDLETENFQITSKALSPQKRYQVKAPTCAPKARRSILCSALAKT